MCVCLCVRACACVYIQHHINYKNKKKNAGTFSTSFFFLVL